MHNGIDVYKIEEDVAVFKYMVCPPDFRTFDRIVYCHVTGHGDLIVSGSDDGYVYIWDSQRGKMQHKVLHCQGLSDSYCLRRSNSPGQVVSFS
jgi:WD40 repeat protein